MATSPSATLTPKTPRVFRGVLYANLMYLLILAGALALQSAVGKPVIAAGLLLAVFLIFLPASIMIGAGVRAAYAARSGKILFLTITVLLSVLLAQDMIPDEALRLVAWCWIGVGQPVMLLGLMARLISRSKAPRKTRNSAGAARTFTASPSSAVKSSDSFLHDYAAERFRREMNDHHENTIRYLHDQALHDACPSIPAPHYPT
ncbi:hypothetical protein EAW52_24185 [Pseudomonas sp. LTJR-52]|uniref:hypothetical protein n=1 Tax=Pseudomonas sp. LTJR-52 TaxID=2479392 RepID=UPI000EFA50A7|nr:hypothetical protein [Pseudomonas sp. LTJR-52]AYN96811.1 hypothetical protein EAW52_24185 [Pseudomonas sp. LTJR-52]